MSIAAPARRDFHELRIARLDRLCEDAVAVTFAVPDDVAADFTFRPGENLTVRRWFDGVEERRNYSISSVPGESLQIGIRLVPGGAFSGWLVGSAKVGDVVEAQHPSGRFVLDAAAGGRHVFIGAGSGITPLLSMASSLLAYSTGRGTLIYGNRRTDTTMFLEQLADLKNRYVERFELVTVMSREPRAVELFNGRLDGDRLADLFDALVPVSDVDGFWLCGPLPMVTEHVEVLTGRGVPASRIHTELFFVDEPPEPWVHPEQSADGGVSVLFTLDGRQTTVSCGEQSTLLSAAQSARSDVPFACRGGVCGTCRARVVTGEVHLRRNFALEPDEVAQGYVLTCQAVPLTSEVVIDFDA